MNNDDERDSSEEAFNRQLLRDGDGEQQTWTFVGHWDESKIVVEYVLPGERADLRVDHGYWPQGLWAAHGTGTDRDATQAAVIAEYEAAPDA